MKYVTREQMQEIDRRTIEDFGIPALILMEHAGKAVADLVASKFPPTAKVTVICGKGNNGGDGFVCARHLTMWRYGVKGVTLAETESYENGSPPAVNLNILNRIGLKIMPVASPEKLGFLNELIRTSDVLVDAIYGTGLTRPVEGVAAGVIELVNGSGVPVVAVDVPSGLDCDRGEPLGVAVQASWTVTMGLPKVGFSIEGAERYTGEVIVADIGIPKVLLR